MPTDDELFQIYRAAVDVAMHEANVRDGFGSNYSRESIVAGLRAVFEQSSAPVDQSWKTDPPAGWFTVGTHVGSPTPLEFWGADEGGVPIWERPAPTDQDEREVNVTPEGIEVKPGQRWRSLDKRDNGRTVTVESVRDGKAKVTSGATRSTISVRRMRRMSTGWELVTPAEHPEPSSDDEDVRDLRELARRARDAQQRVAISPEAAERLADRLVAQSTAEAMLIKVEADAQESVKLYADQYYAAQEKLDRIEKRIGNLSRPNEYGAVPLRWLIRQVAAILNDKEEDRD